MQTEKYCNPSLNQDIFLYPDATYNHCSFDLSHLPHMETDCNRNAVQMVICNLATLEQL